MKWYTEDSGAERGRDRKNEHREARNGGEDGMKIEFLRPSMCVCEYRARKEFSVGGVCMFGRHARGAEGANVEVGARTRY